MVNYDLHKLGWHSFQQLSQTIFREIIGQTIETFLDSNDGGRDGAYTGIWQGDFNGEYAGNFVFQSKFTSIPGSRITISQLESDIAKSKRLVEQGLCDCYVLITNAGITGRSNETIKSAFHAIGIKHVMIFGYTWICQQITENKRLRNMVPRLYGLGDLSEILDERAFEQAAALLSSIKDELAKVVVTKTYNKALGALNEHGFVLLIGEAASGKTTIASLLAMTALDNWQARTLKLVGAASVINHWNPNDSPRFLWVDDAFGTTQFEPELTRAWNQIMPQLKTMLKQGTKIVMTSRDYIYTRARGDLKESAFPLFKESQVVIDLRTLDEKEKQQILYNHLKLGTQSKHFIKAIKEFLPGIAANSRFVPETARRLADPVFTKDLYLQTHYIAKFVEGQQRFLTELILEMDYDNKGALALIYMRNNKLESPIELQPNELNVLDRLNTNEGGCIQALAALKGSLIQYVVEEDRGFWKYKHPTIEDAFAAFLIENPEYLNIYLDGANIEKIITQVTCGEVGIEKAIVVPKSLFPLIAIKLNAFIATSDTNDAWRSQYRATYRKMDFLAFRCSKDFLRMYTSENPIIFQQISNPSIYLDSSSEISLAFKLQEYGLLPESVRLIIKEAAFGFALSGRDLAAVTSTRIRKILTGEEYEDIKAKVLSELIPKLAEVRNNEQNSVRDNESAAEELSSFIESLDELKKVYPGDKTVTDSIAEQLKLLKEWIEDKDQDYTSTPQRQMEKIESIDEYKQTRSIFDDIDD